MPDNILIDDPNKAKDATDSSEELEISDFADSGEEVSEEILWDMINAGLWCGRKKNKTHPKMRQYIFANRNSIEIIDLAKTAQLLDRALDFIKEIAARGGQVLFVATQPSAKKEVADLAEKFNQPYVVNRWLGGTLTNFATLSKRVEYFKKLKSDKAAGALEKYTKKERSEFNKEIERLHTLFSGVERMVKLPEAVLVFNVSQHETAVREAKKMKIPVIGLASTDTNPSDVDYLIPGNDLSASSIRWILGRVEKALLEAPKPDASAPQGSPIKT